VSSIAAVPRRSTSRAAATVLKCLRPQTISAPRTIPRYEPRARRARRATATAWPRALICGTQEVQREPASHRIPRHGGGDPLRPCFDANGGLFETSSVKRTRVISDELKHAYDHRRRAPVEGEAFAYATTKWPTWRSSSCSEGGRRAIQMIAPTACSDGTASSRKFSRRSALADSTIAMGDGGRFARGGSRVAEKGEARRRHCG